MCVGRAEWRARARATCSLLHVCSCSEPKFTSYRSPLIRGINEKTKQKLFMHTKRSIRRHIGSIREQATQLPIRMARLCCAEVNGSVSCCAFVCRPEFIARELKRIDCVWAGACEAG